MASFPVVKAKHLVHLVCCKLTAVTVLGLIVNEIIDLPVSRHPGNFLLRQKVGYIVFVSLYKETKHVAVFIYSMPYQLENSLCRNTKNKRRACN